MPEESFYGLLKICDAFDLVQLEAGFVEEIHPELEAHPLLTADDLAALGPGLSATELSELLDQSPHTLSLELRSGRRIGLMHAAHDVDTSLAADVLLENLCCKATAVMAMRTLITQQQIDPDAIPYILNSGEEAVGDRYQRGGGNLAKAVAEMSHCQLATGVDIKGFCCGPVHALMLAGSLVSSRVYDQVAVIGG
ncbi:glycine reductase, partial [Candidatus Entotheonella serta]